MIVTQRYTVGYYAMGGGGRKWWDYSYHDTLEDAQRGRDYLRDNLLVPSSGIRLVKSFAEDIE